MQAHRARRHARVAGADTVGAQSAAPSCFRVLLPGATNESVAQTPRRAGIRRDRGVGHARSERHRARRAATPCRGRHGPRAPQERALESKHEPGGTRQGRSGSPALRNSRWKAFLPCPRRAPARRPANRWRRHGGARREARAQDRRGRRGGQGARSANRRCGRSGALVVVAGHDEIHAQRGAGRPSPSAARVTPHPPGNRRRTDF